MEEPPALHRSLLRQLRHLGLGPDLAPADPAQWQDVLNAISRSYRLADEERYTLERSLEVSTSEMRQLHDTLSHRARHDTLTGLPNRASMTELLDVMLSGGRDDTHDAALLFIDLDGFKLVNDTLGHQVGDELLVQAAERICSCVRPDDSVARLGGDEFVVLCPGAGTESAAAIARRIGESLQAPFVLHPARSTDNVSASVSCSIGLATARGAAGADQLLANADMAMYEAKAQGRSRFIVFDDAMRSRVESQLDVEGALWQVIERDELDLHYQPVVDLASGRMISAEALVRWCRPGHPPMVAADFIPVAERSRLVTIIDEWVLERACRDAAAWPDPEVGVSVNLSTRDLQAEAFLATLSRALDRSGLDPARLTLELTEAILMSDADASTDVLCEAARLGVRTAVDDFGAGYWSIAHLRRLPVQTLKIDESIVGDVVDDRSASAICRAVIAMGHALGLHIIAEGISAGPLAAAMTELGCDAGQGDWFAAPSPGSPTLPARVPSARRG